VTESDLTAVIASGDYRESLVALRDRLADAIDDTRRAQHKRVCHCECGIGDDRTLVIVTKALVDVLGLLDALPNAERKSRSDDLAERRARRLAVAADS
jgi:hypothetical protein